MQTLANLNSEIHSFGSVSKERREAYTAEIKKTFTENTLKAFGKVFLLGAGTSYAAVLAAREAFRLLTSWSGEKVTAMTSSQFAYQTFDRDLKLKSLVIIVDPEGNDECAADALQRAKQFPSDVIVLTSVRKSAAAQSADYVIDLSGLTDSFGDVLTYTDVYTALLTFALELGLAQGAIDQKAYNLNLNAYDEYVADSLSYMGINEHAVQAAAAEITEKVRNYETIGTAADYASAWLVRSVIYREIGRVTTVEESEDYLHVNALNVEPDGFATFVFAARDNCAYDRTLRTVLTPLMYGRTVVVVTDGSRSEWPRGAHVLKVPDSVCPAVKPLLMFVPAAQVIALL